MLEFYEVNYLYPHNKFNFKQIFHEISTLGFFRIVPFSFTDDLFDGKSEKGVGIMVRRSSSILDDLAEMLSKFPWWAGIGLAFISFLLLNWFAEISSTAGTGTGRGLTGIVCSLAFWAQFVVPALLLSGAFVSWLRNFKRAGLYEKISRRTSHDCLRGVSRRDYEYVVGEYFRRLHFIIAEVPNGLNADVKFVAEKGHERYLVRCKNGIADEVKESEVRELIGAVVAMEATGGIVVTSGECTKEAITLARANRITLLDSKELHGNMRSRELIDLEPQRTARRWPRKIFWILVALVMTLAAASLFYSNKKGVPVYTVWTTQFRRFFPGKQEQVGTRDTQKEIPGLEKKPKTFTITDDQLKKASEQILHKKEQEQFKKIESNKREKEKKYYYELELVSGGTIFTDNITITDKKITYRNQYGLIVSINKAEVKNLHKILVEK